MSSLNARSWTKCDAAGFRLLGPKSLGVMCPRTGLNATVAHAMARPGKIAFLSRERGPWFRGARLELAS